MFDLSQSSSEYGEGSHQVDAIYYNYYSQVQIDCRFADQWGSHSALNCSHCPNRGSLSRLYIRFGCSQVPTHAYQDTLQLLPVL